MSQRAKKCHCNAHLPNSWLALFNSLNTQTKYLFFFFLVIYPNKISSTRNLFLAENKFEITRYKSYPSKTFRTYPNFMSTFHVHMSPKVCLYVLYSLHNAESIMSCEAFSKVESSLSSGGPFWNIVKPNLLTELLQTYSFSHVQMNCFEKNKEWSYFSLIYCQGSKVECLIGYHLSAHCCLKDEKEW